MSPKKARIRTTWQRRNKQTHKSLRVLIMSAQTLWREGLRRLLDNSGADIVVIGEAAHISDAITKVSELRPDILILDLMLSKLDGLEVLRRLKRLENVPKVILTEQMRQENLAKALQFGVKGIVLKGSPLDELIRCIRWIAAGGTCIGQNHGSSESTSSIFGASARRSRQGQQFHITDREMEVVEAVVAGCTNKEIASRFRLSVDTVRHHVTNIFNKTGASNRLELVLFALEKNLVDSSRLGIGVTPIAAALQRKRSA